MKQILLSAAMSLFVLATPAQDMQVVINGTAPQGKSWVYYFYDGNARHVDSLAVTNGKFALNVSKPANTFVTFMTDDDHKMVVVADKTPILADLANLEVKGSVDNVELNKFHKKQLEADKQLQEEYFRYKSEIEKNPAAEEKATEEFDKVVGAARQKQIDDIKQFARTHRNSVIPAYYIGHAFYGMEYEDLDKVLDEQAAYYSHPMLAEAKQLIGSIAKRKPGLMFTDLAMNDVQGKEAKLSQWVGKGNYVLVDFWASWCGPCRVEMPHVVEAYNRYHDSKGFEVVGVSLDTKEDAWKKGIADLGIKWHNISDLKGWKSAAVGAYGISFIPSNILIDPQGKIVAVDLRGDGLAAKLKKIYGE